MVEAVMMVLPARWISLSEKSTTKQKKNKLKLITKVINKQLK